MSFLKSDRKIKTIEFTQTFSSQIISSLCFQEELSGVKVWPDSDCSFQLKLVKLDKQKFTLYLENTGNTAIDINSHHLVLTNRSKHLCNFLPLDLLHIGKRRAISSPVSLNELIIENNEAISFTVKLRLFWSNEDDASATDFKLAPIPAKYFDSPNHGITEKSCDPSASSAIDVCTASRDSANLTTKDTNRETREVEIHSTDAKLNPSAQELVETKASSDLKIMNSQIVIHLDPSCLATAISKEFNSPKYADWMIICQETEIPCHKLILQARSKVFKRLLEPTEGVFGGYTEIQDLDYYTLKAMLKFIYTDTIELYKTNAARLFAAADQYHIPLLLAMCEDLLALNLKVDNVATCFQLAILHQKPTLKEKCMNFIWKNWSQVKTTQSWSDLVNEYNSSYHIEELIEYVCDQNMKKQGKNQNLSDGKVEKVDQKTHLKLHS